MEGILSQLAVALPEGQPPEASVDTAMTQIGQLRTMRLYSVFMIKRMRSNTQPVKRVVIFPGDRDTFSRDQTGCECSHSDKAHAIFEKLP